jgi:hypothetical protein
MRQRGIGAPVSANFKSKLGEFIFNRPLIFYFSGTAPGTAPGTTIERAWAEAALGRANRETIINVQACSIIYGHIRYWCMAMGATAMDTKMIAGVGEVGPWEVAATTNAVVSKARRITCGRYM